MSVSQAMTLQMPRGDVRPAHPALVTSLFPARDFCPVIKVFVHSRWEDGWEAQPSKLTELKPTLKPWQWAHREPAEGGHPLPAAPHIRNARSYPTWRGEAVVPSVLCATCCGSCVFFLSCPDIGEVELSTSVVSPPTLRFMTSSGTCRCWFHQAVCFLSLSNLISCDLPSSIMF